VKCHFAKEARLRVLERLETWKRHKFALTPIFKSITIAFFLLVMILYHFVAMYQSHLAHFAIEALNELGIARWFFINMHITLGVPHFF
jgi:hypothetical protein